MTHNPMNHDILQTVKRFLPIVHQSSCHRQIIKEQKTINSRRQPTKLTKYLVKARFKPEEETIQVTKYKYYYWELCDLIEQERAKKFQKWNRIKREYSH